MNVSLHIERLVVDGLPLTTAQGPAFHAALEGELMRLLREQGLGGVTGGAQPALSIAPIALAAGSSPAQWGAKGAQGVHAGLATTPTGTAGNISRR